MRFSKNLIESLYVQNKKRIDYQRLSNLLMDNRDCCKMTHLLFAIRFDKVF